MEIIGRERELAAADLFLGDAARGFSVLELSGEAGIGKTTVWRAVLARAEESGFDVLACRTAPAEAKLSFSAISDLLEHVPDEDFAVIPAPQRRALDIALLRADAGDASVDRRTVAVAVRALLRELAARRPLLLAVDDLHWLDAASIATLEFALRRLDTEPIGFLSTCRAGEPTRLEVRMLGLADARSVTIGPLSVAGLHHLLRERLDHVPPRSLVTRIADASHGNPLFALEIGRLLAEQGAPPPGEPLPVPPDVEALVRRRIAGLPRATREVLLAASALSDPTEDVVRAALRRPIVRELEPAERRQIARLEGGVIVFSHPLLAGAVYASATAAERRDLHGRLAEVVPGSEARARHLALAAEGPDEVAAASVQAAAAEAAARGAPAAAAELAELAVALSEPRSEAECLRLLHHAEYVLASGDGERALALLEAVESWEHWPPNPRASAFALVVQLTLYAGGPPATVELAERALAEATPAQVRAVAHDALSYSAGLDDAERALVHAETALALLEELGENVDGVQLSTALKLRLRAGVVLGHGLDRGLVDRVRALEARLPPAHVNRPTVVGAWFRWVDELATSRELLERDLQLAEARGHETRRAYASMQLALTECDTGELARAHEHATAAHDLARELELAEIERWAADALALVEATLGRADKAHELLRGAESTPNARAILGRLESSRANNEAADVHLRAVLDLIEQAGIREPGIWRVHADAAEVAVALGDLERADGIAGFVEQHGERTGRRWSLATGARVRGLIAAARGDLEEGLAACEQALEHHEGVPMPLERARTLLVRGVIERRLRRRRRARLAFEEALTSFEQAGARLWAERARGELARLGLRRADSGELTEAERRVAELTARGLTRRDVASALHISPKTVDATLGRVYRKLDIHSRAELGARMVQLKT
jgi:DNA-binding CsgD family transcriptional regulator